MGYSNAGGFIRRVVCTGRSTAATSEVVRLNQPQDRACGTELIHVPLVAVQVALASTAVSKVR